MRTSKFDQRRRPRGVTLNKKIVTGLLLVGVTLNKKIVTGLLLVGVVIFSASIIGGFFR
jgi:hypothetical protein